MSEGFIFYKSFADALENLPAEQYKTVVSAICKYALNGEEPSELDPICLTVFTLVKPQLDANAKRREAGRKGGEANTKQTGSKPEANCKQTEANTKQNEANSKQTEAKEKVKDKVKVKEKKETSKEKSVEGVVASLDAPDEVKNKLLDFIGMRKAIKKPMTPYAVTLLYGKLVKISDDPVMQCGVLDQSILHSWQDVYPLKSDGKKKDDDDSGEYADIYAQYRDIWNGDSS